MPITISTGRFFDQIAFPLTPRASSTAHRLLEAYEDRLRLERCNLAITRLAQGSCPEANETFAG